MNRLVRTALTLGAAGTLGLSALGTANAAPTASDDAQVSVFHGIPGVTVDVWANGRQLLSDVKPGTITSPMDLKQGDYDVRIVRAGSSQSSTPLVSRTVDVKSGSNDTIVANLNTSGDPAINTFTNDVSQVPSGKARLTVRHVAAAPAVDVRLGDRTVFKDLKNPEQARAEVDSGTVNTRVLLTGTDTTVVGPVNLPLPSGSNTVVYAWGSSNDRNVGLEVQTLGG